MTAIASALMAGHSVKSVLKYLSQNNPQLASQISTAINAGYTIDHVLKYLSKNEKKMEPLTNPKLSSNIFEQGQSRVHPSLINAGKLAGTAAAVGLGAYGLSRLAPQATHAISGQVLPAIPGIPPQSGQKGLPAPKIPGGPQGPIPTNPVQTPPNTQQQPMQTPQQQQPTQTPMTQPVPNLAVFKKYPGLESKIADLRNAGNDAISIAGYFQKFNPSQTKKLEAEAGEPFEQLVEKYIAHTPIQSKQQQPMQPAEQDLMPEQSQQMPAEQTQNFVATPEGLGVVKTKNEKNTLIDSDGKMHQVKSDHVIEPPEPMKDVLGLYEQLMSSIPENQKSAMINVAGYDPNHNELIFMPHGSGSALYVYKDIPPEFADQLKNSMFTAKTSGDTLYGAWSEGEESRGAGMFQLIRELQKHYGGKGKEYVRKYEKVFDFLTLPKLLHEQSERKKKEDARAMKKKNKGSK